MRKIKREDYDRVVKWEDLGCYDYCYCEEALDKFADTNMDFVRIEGREIPIALDCDNRVMIVFDVDGVFDLANPAVEILEKCKWDDTPVTDMQNCICLIDGMYNCGVFYNF